MSADIIRSKSRGRQVASPSLHSSPGKLIRVNNDEQALRSWIDFHEGTKSPETIRLYTREGERCLSWVKAQGLTLQTLAIDDAVAYLKLLAAPPARLVGPHRRLKAGEKHKPFRKGLQNSSINHTRRVLGGWFGYLKDGGYLAANVFRLVSVRKGVTEKFSTHTFDRDTWNALFGEIVSLAEDPRYAGFHAARCRWIICLITMSGMRRSEAASITMNSFFYRSKCWWLKVIGKGQKEREISVTPELLDELGLWRTFLGLSPLPSVNEDVPAIVAKGSPKKAFRGIQGGTVYRIVDEVFRLTAARLKAKGLELEASQIADASVHWLRHTNANFRLEDGQVLRDVQEELGHGDISTTQIYLAKNKKSRHARAQGVRFRPPSAKT